VTRVDVWCGLIVVSIWGHFWWLGRRSRNQHSALTGAIAHDARVRNAQWRDLEGRVEKLEQAVFPKGVPQ
jgi:hypothetical protein